MGMPVQSAKYGKPPDKNDEFRFRFSCLTHLIIKTNMCFSSNSTISPFISISYQDGAIKFCFSRLSIELRSFRPGAKSSGKVSSSFLMCGGISFYVVQ